MRFFFFFQAEDGIRDWSVTGVQTCALPISKHLAPARSSVAAGSASFESLSVSLRVPRWAHEYEREDVATMKGNAMVRTVCGVGQEHPTRKTRKKVIDRKSVV